MATSRRTRPPCITERKLYVEIADIDKPVLLARDHAQILADSDGQVQARCREHLGTIKLLLKAAYQCPDDVFLKAKEQAMVRIQCNYDYPPQAGQPTCDTRAHHARMQPKPKSDN